MITAKNLVIQSMQTGVDGFVALNNGDVEMVEAKFDIARDLAESYAAELERIFKCAPNCE